MSGRPRTSTLVISGLFLAVLALYILVRPVSTAASGGHDPARHHIFLDRTGVHAHLAPADPVASPVAYGEPLGHAG